MKKNLSLFLFLICLAACGGGTTASLDSTTFTVSTIVPASAVTGVATDANIVVTLSAAVDDTTVSGNFTVTPAGGSAVSGSFSYNTDKTEITFNPTGDLSPSTVYTVALTASIQTSADVALTASSTTFTTGADTVAPTVTVKNSAGTTLATSGNSLTITKSSAEDISITFSEAMDTSTITSSNVTLTCNGITQGTLAAATDTDSVSGNEWTYTLSDTNFPQNTCTLAFTTGVKDANANAIAATSYALLASCGPNDEFTDSATLSSCWTENDDNSSGTFDINSTTSGQLTGVHNETDSDEATLTFPSIWKRVTGDFAVTLHVSSVDSGTDRETMAFSAVEASGSATNYLDLWFGRDNTPGRNELFAQVNGGADQADNLSSDATALYLCLIRSGNTVTAKFSSDGTSFSNITGASVTLTTTNTDIHVGLLSDGAATGFTAIAQLIHFNEGSTTCP